LAGFLQNARHGPVTARAVPKEGGLIGYGPRFTEVGRQLVKILRRANPGAIPVEQPSRFELIINLQTAKAIGVEIPPNFVLHADKLIE
jgi:putative ABC transport system substrate-binding protein